MNCTQVAVPFRTVLIARCLTGTDSDEVNYDFLPPTKTTGNEL